MEILGKIFNFLKSLEKCKLHVPGQLSGVTVSVRAIQVQLTVNGYLIDYCCYAIFFLAVMRTSRRNYGGGNHRQVTLNDMPVPEGDFMALHKKRQSRHHTVLAIGIVSLSFALSLYKNTDIIFFNFSPPDTYE